MVTIGENLKYERNEVVEVDNSAIRLKSAPNKTKQILISEIKTNVLEGTANSALSLNLPLVHQGKIPPID